MSTANFSTPNFELPLICGGMDYEEKKKQWEAESDEEYDEDMFARETDWEYRGMEEEVAEFNDKLEHFEVFIEGGYYQGYMFNVRQKQNEYWDYYDLNDMTEEDADYYYGDSKANVIAEYERDMKLIKDYLKELKERGFYELNKVAQFSNGEAIYQRA